MISEEELNQEYPMSMEGGYPHSDELDKKTESLSVRVEFEVTCDSSPYVGYENSIAKRIRDYIKQCYDAMDDSMRHWGDHTHFIDPIRVILTNLETEEEQDITTEILGDEEVAEGTEEEY